MRLHLDVTRVPAVVGAGADVPDPKPWGPFREIATDDGGAILVAQRVAIEVSALLPVLVEEDPKLRILRALSR